MIHAVYWHILTLWQNEPGRAEFIQRTKPHGSLCTIQENMATVQVQFYNNPGEQNIIYVDIFIWSLNVGVSSPEWPRWHKELFWAIRAVCLLFWVTMRLRTGQALCLTPVSTLGFLTLTFLARRRRIMTQKNVLLIWSYFNYKQEVPTRPCRVHLDINTSSLHRPHFTLYLCWSQNNHLLTK